MLLRPHGIYDIHTSGHRCIYSTGSTAWSSPNKTTQEQPDVAVKAVFCPCFVQIWGHDACLNTVWIDITPFKWNGFVWSKTQLVISWTLPHFWGALCVPGLLSYWEKIHNSVLPTGHRFPNWNCQRRQCQQFVSRSFKVWKISFESQFGTHKERKCLRRQTCLPAALMCGQRHISGSHGNWEPGGDVWLWLGWRWVSTWQPSEWLNLL